MAQDTKLENSVQGLVKTEKGLESQTQNRALTREERMGMQKTTPQGAELALCDISGSMAGPAKDGRRCIDCLRDAMAPLVNRVHVLAFETHVHEVDADLIPEPMGGTNLTAAIDKATTLKPTGVLVVSDGAPNDRESALESARTLVARCKVRINVIYIGPDDTACKDFMKELAKIGHGRYKEFDIAVNNPLLLGDKVKSLLSLPAPKGAINL